MNALPSTAAVSACPHCATAVHGPAGTYCCSGCEAAAEIIRGAGLEGYYAARDQVAPRARGGDQVAWHAVPTQAEADGSASVTLQIDGFHCASCVWVTEKVLERTEGVQRATVSYASGRAKVVWDPQRVDLAALTHRVRTLGYRPRPAGAASQVDRDLLLRLGVAAFCTANVMGFSVALYAGWADGMDARFVALFQWMSLLLATPVVTWSAAPFFTGAWQGLRARVLHMDVPISVAVLLLYGHGLWATLQHQDSYLDSLTMLVFLLLTGRVLEARGRKAASEAASSLSAMVPTEARRRTSAGVETVAASELVVGDRLELGLGAELAADGVVVEGRAQVRMAMVTGESRPVEAVAGTRLVAGAVVDEGSVVVAVTRTGGETLLGRMAEELMAAGDAPRVPRPTDALAPAFTAATLVVATLTGVGVWAATTPDEALARCVAVLVVACPCALALSEPLVGAAAVGAAARRGVLLRSADGLHALARVTTVVLDKTGTITGGRPEVVSASDAALSVAAGLERTSQHPLASAILEAAVSRGLPVPLSEAVVERAGRGVEGRVNGAWWSLGAGRPGELVLRDAEAQVQHVLQVRDCPRPGAAEDLRRLEGLGVRVLLLSGDASEVAAEIGRAVGLSEHHGDVDPTGKAAFVRDLERNGEVVAFVGDGVNDGPALAAATVGLAMGHGAASSVLVADGVLVADRLNALGDALVAARVGAAAVQASLRRSVLYNVVAVVGAILGAVNPLVAAVLMPLSSGMVIAGALRVEGRVARDTRRSAEA